MKLDNIKSRLSIVIIIFILLVPVAGQAEPIVRMQTVMGDIGIELYDGITPLTVKNFLTYVENGDYDGTFIHRGVLGFISQGGGYRWQGTEWGWGYPSVVSYGTVLNEPFLSNTRGTITMAKVGGDPDSATNQWFFNVADNSANLDNQNGGFTVFGHVIGEGMSVVDYINNLPAFPFNPPPFFQGPYGELPLFNYTGDDFNNQILPTQDNVVIISRVFEDINGDSVPDRDQTHVTSIWNSEQRYISFLTYQSDNVLLVSEIDTAVIDTIGAPTKDDKIVEIMQGIQQIRVESVTSDDGSVNIMVVLPKLVKPDSYYVYGKTTDNLNDHWHEFNYDGNTGIEIFGNIVVIHLIDGQRGDSDLTVNGVVNLGIGATVNIKELPHVKSILNSYGNTITFISPEGTIITPTEVLPDIIKSTVTDQTFPDNQFISFSQGVQVVSVDNVTSTDGKTTITLILPSGAEVTSYYLYGATTKNTDYHWYEFKYDGTTGAVVNGNIVTLYFVDGQRGDSDMIANGVINMGGGAVQITPVNEGTVDADSASGCTLSTKVYDSSGAGSWILIMFYLVAIRLYRWKLGREAAARLWQH